jgi:peptide/nickel transport system permease protein
MLQLVFALYFDVLPSSGMKDPVMYEFMSPSQQLVDRLGHVLLPGVAMGLAGAASIARYMRSTLLEVVRQDYIRTARSKGVPEWRVTVKHAMRNALLPIVTLFGLSLPFLFSGSVLVEYVFAWPGMGQLIVEAIRSQDTPLIMGCFFVFTLVVVAGNLLADLLYAVVDPRIRYD